MSLALRVNEDRGAPLGHHRGDVQIDDLPPLVNDHSVKTSGQQAAVNRDLPDDNGIGHLLQGDPDMPRLTAGFAAAGQPRLLFAKRVGGRRLAAVGTVEPQPIEQRRHQQQQHFEAALEHRRKPLLDGEQVGHLLHGLFDIDVVERHFAPVVVSCPTTLRVLKPDFCPPFALCRILFLRDSPGTAQRLRSRHQRQLFPSLIPNKVGATRR